ncbi:phospholipase D-like domain-containing protein [Nannocystis bainbridge]|uniref:Phospholipase D-like domain-containing protein n=1 Tax=Nannocystis bainbridge TaxID=2995303 RepID=A0ABT5DS38_9BACT|nr:phospholipase D-like domain-containing protein [Nannocystis bainbridge]MDC0716361.1 phospholipase D-like domain-containing protein [Nannocystis bainbridge]
MIETIVATAALVVLVTVLAANFATPEKKLARRVHHHHDVCDPQFRREMGVLLGPSIVEGNSVVDLQNGDEIFPAMLAAIRGARSTIEFETYIYWSGAIGREFSEALSERARAGVKVCVILDWAGVLKMDDALLDEMRRAGVRVERYRPLRWYNLSRLNNRTHRKLLVVDGQIGFTGGVGIADLWTGHAQDPEHWRDMHFRVEGPVVSQIQAAFNDNWIKTTGEVLNGEPYFPAPTRAGSMAAHLFISSPAGGSESMHLMYLMAIAAAARSIDLAASYFVPDALIDQELLAARRRGVRVRILLPGVHTDSEAVRLASKAGWGPLLEAGVEIHEYAPTMLHTKLLIVDGEMVSVGSTNFDIRSFRLNDEASLNVYDAGFAARMTAQFEADLQRARACTLATWLARPLREKLAEKLVRPIKSQL